MDRGRAEGVFFYFPFAVYEALGCMAFSCPGAFGLWHCEAWSYSALGQGLLEGPGKHLVRCVTPRPADRLCIGDNFQPAGSGRMSACRVIMRSAS